MKKCLRIALVSLIVVMTAVVACYATDYKYPDLTWITKDKSGKEVVNVHFATREITQATNINVMEGYPDGTFRPDDPVKRSEFIKMLIGLATNRTFDFGNIDSKYNTWYGPYVTVAEMQGVIEKDQYTQKELEEPITRLEMILMLAKTQINMKGIPQNQLGKLVYTDIDGLTQDEKDLVLHAAQYDLLEGMKDGSIKLLEPNKNLTRGEAAAALMRIY